MPIPALEPSFSGDVVSRGDAVALLASSGVLAGSRVLAVSPGAGRTFSIGVSLPA